MVAANQPLMRPIDNPFVDEWDIEQVFQLSVNDGLSYAFGYFDQIQQQLFIQVGQGGPYFAVGANFTLRQLLTEMRFDLNDAHFIQAAWMGRAYVDRPPMPALDDMQALLNLTIGALQHPDFAASFKVVAHLLPAAQM